MSMEVESIKLGWDLPVFREYMLAMLQNRYRCEAGRRKVRVVSVICLFLHVMTLTF